ncbi:helix-turn-helix domain-containing protein [Pseudonocardia hispaniensis]|uniref:Helix-turn-helix domain-containing protein n=1 Tax=Pseudonocardia hispaniensis TaxID=904933 RepID=A0ABW1J6C8_9PSEU
MPESRPKPWPESLAAAVGQRVAYYRRERGLTAQQLSDELKTRLGVNMKRTVLGGLESGARKAVGLAEILAIAYVLGVPPLLLMTPLGERADIELLPGVDADPWDAAQWITGEGKPPSGSPDALWRRNADLLTLYREHTAKEAEWRAQTRIPPDLSPEEANRLFERAAARRAEIEDALRYIRRSIRGRGDLPPALPPELAHLDADEPEPRLRPTADVVPARSNEAESERVLAEVRLRRQTRRKDGSTGE